MAPGTENLFVVMHAATKAHMKPGVFFPISNRLPQAERTSQVKKKKKKKTQNKLLGRICVGNTICKCVFFHKRICLVWVRSLQPYIRDIFFYHVQPTVLTDTLRPHMETKQRCWSVITSQKNYCFVNMYNICERSANTFQAYSKELYTLQICGTRV